MAKIRRLRNKKGHFIKATRRRRRRKVRVKARRRARRRVRRNPSARRRRRVRVNSGRRRRRRARRNPGGRHRRRRNPLGHGVFARADGGLAAHPIGFGAVVRGKRKVDKRRVRGYKSKPKRTAKQRAATRALIAYNKGKKGRKSSKKRGKSKSKAIVRYAPKKGSRKRRSSLWRQVRRYRKRALGGRKRSLKRSVAMAQYHRAAALRKVIARRGPAAGKKSALAKAMHLKTNPGLAGFLNEAKQLVPQGAVATGAALGTALLGTKIADALSPHLTFVPPSVQPYLRPIATVLATGGAVWGINKVAPKFKGAVAIGGLVAAGFQVVSILTSTATPGGVLDQAKKALGLGDYTMIGGRSYAEAGIFRDIGDYTQVGDYTRVGGADDATEWARDSLRGLDDATEFAPGEGGVLNGGMFRGPSSR